MGATRRAVERVQVLKRDEGIQRAVPVAIVGKFNVGLVCAACVSLAAAQPEGTPLEARLLAPLSTYSARRGAEVSAAVATPVCSDGARVLPEGSEIRGVVKRVSRVGLGLVHESAALQLEFRQLVLPGGAAYPITAHLTGVDNARERVDRNGKIHGIRATDTLANRFGERTLFAVTAHPAAMVPLLLFESGMLHFPDPEIEFPRGTALQLTVEFPPPFEDVAPCALPQAEESPEQRTAMQEAVNGLPYWSYSKRHRQPMDLVNLLFLGSREEVERAFQAAGWSGSRDNSVRAGVAAMRAIAEDEAYADAPMRTLLLDGREPDLRLQKSLDTFEKRDHLRVWKRAGELDGSAVWASAATRDLGTTFGMHPFGFTHQIQDDVDLERDKVVHDLLFTGCVDSVAYLARPEGVRESGQVYRRGVSTDARVAVVRLNPCTQAREDFSTVEPLAQPGGAVRVIRRVTLTARNHILRDNLVYRSADAARLGFLVLRNLDRQAMREKRARDEDAKREASRTMVRR